MHWDEGWRGHPKTCQGGMGSSGTPNAHGSRANLVESRPGHLLLLSGDTGWSLGAGCSPHACGCGDGLGAQQHLGVLRVKLEEGEETFVQLPLHLIWVLPGESAAEAKSIQEPVTETICWLVAQSMFLSKEDIFLYYK